MRQHEKAELPRRIYPPEEWRLVETAFAPDYVDRMETLFALSNGYLGIRGAFEERAPVFKAHSFVNGFHETWPIVYGQEAYGLAKTGPTMLPLVEPP
jgi:alpha,alpha-trehalose phosphorylase